jgi:phosphatidylinositol kinase/protein kinase (PI-3  family)
MPCFNNDRNIIISKFIERFNANKSHIEYIQIVDDLIYNSMNNWRTNKYDYFQKLTNGITY